MTTTMLRFLALSAFLAFGVVEGYAQDVVLRASTLNAGAGSSNSGGYILQGTLGQPIIGQSVDAAYRVGHGFWYQVKPTTPVILNSPPTAPQIISPPDGAEIVLGGGTGQDPQDPGNLFTVTWSEAVDPDGDPVAYTWQLSGSADFGEVALEENVGATTRFETTLGELVALLDVPAQTQPGDSGLLWHRAVASDGQAITVGTAARITLIRGTLVRTEDAAAEVPAQFDLHQNYPNPFNPSTTIAYDVPEATEIRLVVYDLFGRALRTLVHATQPAGRYTVQFDAGDLASGTYFYRIEAGSWSQAMQFTLLK